MMMYVLQKVPLPVRAPHLTYDCQAGLTVMTNRETGLAPSIITSHCMLSIAMRPKKLIFVLIILTKQITKSGLQKTY